MKNLFLISLFIMSSFFYSEKTVACPGDIKTTHEDEDIFELFGLLRSSISSDYFVALRSSSYIRIVYMQELPEIEVTIYSESGRLVYIDTIVPTPGNELFVDTSNWSNGMYTIIFKKNSSLFLYGNFQK